LTSRERGLLGLLLAVAASAGVIVGLGTYFERRAYLDAEFGGLQRRALRATQGFSAPRDTGDVSAGTRLKERFFAPGTLPDPLTLAFRAQEALKAAGIRIEESRITENTESSQWVHYRAEGNIESWFRFLELLRKGDSKTIFRSLALAKKQGFTYAIAFEVGHAVLP
jgi:hypothetical protein